MDFPITDLMDEQACYDRLVGWLHPDGFACPRCHAATAWSSTAAAATRSWTSAAATAGGSSTPSPGRPCTAPSGGPGELVLILRGFAQGVPTAQLARELGCDRPELLRLRHRLQGLAFDNRDRMPLDDQAVEADEAYQNAGEKRRPAHRPGGPAAAAGATRRAGTAPGRTTGRRSAGSSVARGARSG